MLRGPLSFGSFCYRDSCSFGILKGYSKVGWVRLTEMSRVQVGDEAGEVGCRSDLTS